MSVDTAILIAKWAMAGQLVLACVLSLVWLHSTWRYQKLQADLNRCQSMPAYKEPEQ